VSYKTILKFICYLALVMPLENVCLHTSNMPNRMEFPVSRFSWTWWVL